MTPLPAGRPVRLPSTCLVVLVGPSGAGKSTWAAAQFRPSQVVSTDALRALVGEGDHDQRAGTDAFAVLDDVLERRLRRRLLTVIDSLGLEPARRRAWLAIARRHGVPCHAVTFATPAAVCRDRNRRRQPPLPSKVVTSQQRAFETALAVLADEGFDGVHEAGDVEIVPPALVGARRPPPPASATIRWPCASGCRSRRSPGTAARPSWGRGSGPSPPPPRRPASPASGSWTTSCRSRSSGGSGST